MGSVGVGAAAVGRVFRRLRRRIRERVEFACGVSIIGDCSALSVIDHASSADFGAIDSEPIRISRDGLRGIVESVKRHLLPPTARPAAILSRYLLLVMSGCTLIWTGTTSIEAYRAFARGLPCTNGTHTSAPAQRRLRGDGARSPHVWS